MHYTKNKDTIKNLKRMAHIEEIASKHLSSLDNADAQDLAQELKISSSRKMDSIKALKLQARVENLTVYCVKMEKIIRKKGDKKTYTYWYASWRVGRKVKNVYLGSTRKMDHDEALTKARKLKRAFFVGI